MRDLILRVILGNWNRYVFPGITMQAFFADIYKYLTLLDIICLDDTHSIAIHARRSRQWIALYLACYIKGVDFVVLSPNLSREKLFNTLNFISISYLFTEPFLVGFNHNDMRAIPFLKGAYDMIELKPISLRSGVYNNNLSHLSLQTIDEYMFDTRTVELIQEEYGFTDKESCVINMTSGVSHIETKLTVSSAKSIEITVLKGMEVLPYNESHKVYSEVEFAHSHIISVLIPFFKGCVFVPTADDANVIIESTESFERKWYEAVEYLFETKFLYKLFKQRIFKSLFNRIAGRMIRAHYSGIEHIIVYNGSIQERALKIAKRYLQLSVTYGSQESNQLMACNNFSALAYKKQGSVGRVLGIFTVGKKGELYFESEGVFSYYLGDESHTNYVKTYREWMKEPIIYTGDQGYIIRDTVFLRGRMTSEYKRERKSINLDEIERHIRSLPFIEECLLVPWENNDVNLLVRVNQRLVEAHKLGWIETTSLLDKFYKTLGVGLKEYIVLANTIISPEPFMKSFDGKIRTKLYRPD